MQFGYIFLCNSKALTQCLKNKQVACTSEESKKIHRGALIFLYNSETNNIVGPFTAVSEGATSLETGAWNSEINRQSVSGNIKLVWEDLRQLENATKKFPYLNNLTKCELTALETQELLTTLRESPAIQRQTMT